MHYGKSLESSIWAFAWLPTTTEWTIVKTAPLELLCEYSRGNLRPRLAQVSMLLGCSAMQVNMYDGVSIYTVEADSTGNCCISGETLDEVQMEVPEQLLPQISGSQAGNIGLSSSRRKPFFLSPA